MSKHDDLRTGSSRSNRALTFVLVIAMLITAVAPGGASAAGNSAAGGAQGTPTETAGGVLENQEAPSEGGTAPTGISEAVGVYAQPAQSAEGIEDGMEDPAALEGSRKRVSASADVMTWSELATRISAAAENETIYLGANITAGSALPTISKSLTIDGNNFKMDFAEIRGKGIVLGNVSSAKSLTLRNIIIRKQGNTDESNGTKRDGDR